MAAEWTDEKHSMYIKSIEASFVNQLYDSKQTKASFSKDPATTSGQHYRSSSKQRSIVAPSLQEGVTTTSKGTPSGSGHLHLCESRICHKDMLCSDTEMSDQNFVDEEVKGKKQNGKSKLKRQRSLITDAQGNDQMVPNRKSSSGGHFTKNFVTAA
ncbi:hypothetical protein VNO78_28808 [Psophocarpus tetragonolobus]|uniref:Uncharacterized protein n=1 Tax=Psophocarpus tetragonolobus TaxID=3891 RepID=A0AAN9RTX0_PSOTE